MYVCTSCWIYACLQSILVSFEIRPTILHGVVQLHSRRAGRTICLVGFFELWLITTNMSSTSIIGYGKNHQKIMCNNKYNLNNSKSNISKTTANEFYATIHLQFYLVQCIVNRATFPFMHEWSSTRLCCGT